jgi:hypothetical protein
MKGRLDAGVPGEKFPALVWYEATRVRGDCNMLLLVAA